MNASSDQLPGAGSTLDAMRLNWGPYLWMRCYNNGAQFLDRVVGERPDWDACSRSSGSDDVEDAEPAHKYQSGYAGRHSGASPRDFTRSRGHRRKLDR